MSELAIVRIFGMVQISQIPGNIDLSLHSAWQPQSGTAILAVFFQGLEALATIWGWLHRFWSFAIPKLRLRLPPRIKPCQIFAPFLLIFLTFSANMRI